MAIVTNFDELSKLHKRALVGGAKSGAWIEFAVTMMDSFPRLYETAKGLNARLSEFKHQKMASAYRVTLLNRSGELKAETTLPFVPFVGLRITPPWSTEYMEVQEVFWDTEAGAFDVYLETDF